MATSQELHKRRMAAVAKGVGSVITSYVDHAGGGAITDVDGREWIEFAAGIVVTNVGWPPGPAGWLLGRGASSWRHTSGDVATPPAV